MNALPQDSCTNFQEVSKNVPADLNEVLTHRERSEQGGRVTSDL